MDALYNVKYFVSRTARLVILPECGSPASTFPQLHYYQHALCGSPSPATSAQSAGVSV